MICIREDVLRTYRTRVIIAKVKAKYGHEKKR